MHILIVEDDKLLADTLRSLLHIRYAVDICFTLSKAEELADNYDYDLILLDSQLPDGNGAEFAKTLRREKSHVPILMLSGREMVTEKVHALDSGVDDYVLKPCSAEELNARIRALLRRHPLETFQNTIVHHNVSLDLDSGKVSKNNITIKLRKKESQILELLLRHKGKVVRRDTLLNHIWGSEEVPPTNSIEVHITQLRKKLQNITQNNPFSIQSVYGLGYQITG